MQGCKQALERDNGLLSYCTVFLGMLANTSPRGIRTRNRTKISLREVRGAMVVLLSAAVNAQCNTQVSYCWCWAAVYIGLTVWCHNAGNEMLIMTSNCTLQWILKWIHSLGILLSFLAAIIIVSTRSPSHTHTKRCNDLDRLTKAFGFYLNSTSFDPETCPIWFNGGMLNYSSILNCALFGQLQ